VRNGLLVRWSPFVIASMDFAFEKLAICMLASTVAAPAFAQNAVQHLDLARTQYRVRAGEPAPLTAPTETVDFLLGAKSRTVEVDGGQASGIAIASNQVGDQVLLAASPRLQTGAHTVKLTATSETGEIRQTEFAVVVDALPTVPSSATRPPVVLLNGWETGFTGTCPIASSSSVTFGNLAQYLVSDGVPVVYLFDNCAEDPNQTIETLGNDLAAYLKSIRYDNGSQVQQIDLVAHSMGGLIVRAYLAGLQPQSGVVLTPPANTLVRDVVLIATPNFGSFVAGNYASNLGAGTQSAELVPGSSFLWNLGTWNEFGDDLRGVNAIAVVGNAGAYNATIANASDGLVSLTSAALGFVAHQTSVTRIVPYCHIDPSAYLNSALGLFNCSAQGSANVTDTNHLTGQIVRSFLAGTNAWSSIGSSPTSDPYLSKDGGDFFAFLNAAGNHVTDLTQVTWGTLTMSNGGDAGTIFFDDMVFGTGQYSVTSTSKGSFNCGAVTQPVGYFAVTRCKIDPAIVSVTPLAQASGHVVATGGALMINGVGFGVKCSGCKVTATPSGSSSSQTLTINSWSTSAIAVTLPASLTGLLILTVTTSTGADSMNVMAVTSTASLVAAPTSLTFTYTEGGPAPPAQSVQITNGGSGTLSWTASSNQSWLTVTPASGSAPSTLSISVSTSGLDAGSYQGTIQVSAAGVSNSPMTIAVTLTITQASAPVIAAVVNAASSQTGFASATWVSIFGANLSSTTYTWQSSDFVNGALPTSLNGVSVTINGIPAYVGYISPTQVNVLAPDDSTTGAVQVQLTSAQQQSNGFTAQKGAFAPAFFLIGAGPYVAAQHADYTLVGSANLIPGVNTRPAAPGETIQIYGAGFGPANPPLPTGQLISTPSALANQAQVTIGGMAAPVVYAGLVGPGLYQINVTVPNLPNGDASLSASIGGAQSQTGVLITVQQ
jgi:uncharacterized protein (TIGR03437 family)